MGFYQAQKIEKLEARIAALEAALKPFADVAKENIRDIHKDSDEYFVPFFRLYEPDVKLLVGYLRAARAAMEGKDV